MPSQQRRVAAGLKVVDSATLVDSVTGVEYTNVGNQVLDRMTTPVTVGNTTTETTLVSYSDAGGVLDVDRLMHWTLVGTITDSALDTVTVLAFRFKYGATTVITFNVTTDDGATTIGSAQAFRLIFELWASGSTSSQLGVLTGLYPSLTSAGTVGTTIIQRGTAAIDSETPQDLVVTADWNGAAAAATMTLSAATLELL